MNIVHFEKISKYDRTEPVSFGIPFARGELKDPGCFRLLDNEREVLAQSKVTASWPDGSVKWLFVRSLIDLPGNASKEMHFDINRSGKNTHPETRLKLNQQEDGNIDVSTGPLSLRLPAKGIKPVEKVALRGRSIWNNEPFNGFRILYGNSVYNSAECNTVITIEEEGPVCAVVRVDAIAPDDDYAVPGMSARFYFWADMPCFFMDYTFVNRDTQAGRITEVTDWALDILPETGEQVLRRAAKGFSMEQCEKSETEAAAIEFTSDYMLRDSCEHQIGCYAYNSWADWESPSGGLMVSVRHAAQNFPKKYFVDKNRLSIELYPESEKDPLEWFAGTAKTHELLFHFHDSGTDDATLNARAAQFQLPDRPALEPERYGHSGIWLESVFKGPVSRKVMSYFCTLADMRPLGAGIFNFGDEQEWGYTNQGRGFEGVDEGDKLVWLNNEYDLIHHLYVFYARTGERRFLEYATNAASHMMDVDIVHGPCKDLHRGGHRAHVRRHASENKVVPSHQWVQGLFDTYHMTGNPSAKDYGLGIADNIIRHCEKRDFLIPGKASTREMGWALRALNNTWLETNDETYMGIGQKIVHLFQEWSEPGAMLAPYTSHTEVRVNFMNALTGTSLAQWAIANDDQKAGNIVVAIADDIIENGMSPWGMPYYKELPSLKRASAGIQSLELFAQAFMLTGDRKYLEAGLPTLESSFTLSYPHLGSMIKKPMKNGVYRLNHLVPKGGKFFAISMPAVLQFIAASDSRALAASLDYQLRL